MITVGSTVGNYEVLQKIGSGAMGAVFLAEHPSIGRRVALKVIHSDLANNAEMVSRFFTEARALTQISSPHIVDVTDFGQTPDGDNFIVMEYLDGAGLGVRLKQEPVLPVGLALHIGAQVCEGLAASHLRGIVHRDLKPDNIYLVHREGDPTFVKILDFGLAKLTQGGAGSHKTQAGSALGTPHYMAPEQCEGKPDIDGRVDIYALGCILYEMLCGRVPFPGEGFGEVLVRHLREPPQPPSQLNPKIPLPVEMIILRALAKKREQRFQTSQEFAIALRDPEAYRRAVDGIDNPESTLDRLARSPVRAAEGMAAPTAMLEAPRIPRPQMDLTGAPTAMLDAPQLPGRPGAGAGQATAVMGAPTAAGGQSTVMLEAPPPIRRPTPAVVTGVQEVPADGHARSGWMVAAAAFATVVLAAGGYGIYELAFHHRETSVVIASEPGGATVLRDGHSLGTAPVVLKLAAHTETDLVLRLAGYLDQRQHVRADGEPALVVRLSAAPDENETPRPKPTDRPRPFDRPKPVERPKPIEKPKPLERPSARPATPRPPRPAATPAKPTKPRVDHGDDVIKPSF